MMYNSTKWHDRVVDADSGEVIQEGTDQSAANFNNMEKGISDAHVAIALMQNALRHVIDERFQVLETYIQDNNYQTLEYPEGFTCENCTVMSVRYYTHGYSDYVERADNSQICVVLQRDDVYVKCNFESDITEDYYIKVILYRFG